MGNDRSRITAHILERRGDGVVSAWKPGETGPDSHPGERRQRDEQMGNEGGRSRTHQLGREVNAR